VHSPDDLARVVQKRDWLRALNRDPDEFGGQREHAPSSPPISVEELERFEATIGARLPDDYRAFISQVSNGGSHLAPLELWEVEERPITTGELTEDELTVWMEAGRPMRASDTRRDFPLNDLFYPLRLDHARHHYFLPGDAHPLDGCVLLCGAGCGDSYFLVVRGERAGEVWKDQSSAAWPIHPVSKSFFSWYEEGLNHALGLALDRAVRRALVDGTVLDPALVEAVAPTVEAHLDSVLAAVRGFAMLRLWQRRVAPAIALEGWIERWRITLAFHGVERTLEELADTSHAVRARLLRTVGRNREALAAWDRAIAEAPHDTDWPRLKARLQIALGDRAGADQTIWAMVRAKSGSRYARRQVADDIVELAAQLGGDDAVRYHAIARRVRRGRGE
jgi:hypothetical protein